MSYVFITEFVNIVLFFLVEVMTLVLSVLS